MRVVLVALVAALVGCAERRAAEAPAPTPAASATAEPPPARVERARCPSGAANCAAVTGRVLYVERVDADGDGDAHYVVAGGNVTAPGVSVIDVGRRLRPRRLPRAGELVSAAGPVYRGRFGQRQIQATVVHHQRR